MKVSESKGHSVVSDSLRHHGLYSPWNSPGQNTGVGSLSLRQGIFPTQGSNPGLLHCRWILYQLSHKGSPRILEWVAYPFSRVSSQPRNQTEVSCIAGGSLPTELWGNMIWYKCALTFFSLEAFYFHICIIPRKRIPGISLLCFYLASSWSVMPAEVVSSVKPYWQVRSILFCHFSRSFSGTSNLGADHSTLVWPACEVHNSFLNSAIIDFKFTSVIIGEGDGTPLEYSCLENPWMEEPGRLQSMGSLKVGHDWATSLSLFTFLHWRRKWQPTPVFLPGESQERGSLVGCRLWGRTESDTTEATQQQQQQ